MLDNGPSGEPSGEPSEGLGDALHAAIAAGGLSLRYQPKYDLFRRRITGVEALARWPRLNADEISPTVFIPLAEAEGLIVALGTWVLNEACRQIAHWRRHGIHLTVAVNVSPLQLGADAELEKTVLSVLKANGVPASQLELEVTEGVLMASEARKTLDRLIDHGIAITLDDFGTGYSSLAYLKNLRASTLKIDKSFVDDLPSSLADCMVIDAVVRLAHSFGMVVVAEGVETSDQQDVLELMGCDLIQGFVLSAPVHPDQIPQLVSQAQSASDRLRRGSALSTLR